MMRSWIPVLTVACFLSCSHASAAPQGAAAVQGEAVLQETPEQLQQLAALIALHELFDKVNEDVEGYVDLIAERAVQLGGVAEGTARSVAKRSTLAEYALKSGTGRQHVDALSSALAAFGKLIRSAIEDSGRV